MYPKPFVMKRIILLFSILFLISCSKEIKDGPFVYFANESEIPDTLDVATDSLVTYKIKALSNGYKLNRIQLFVNTSEYFDTTFSAVDSIEVEYEMNFKGKLRTQNVLIQAIDKNEMFSTQTKPIFIR